MKNNNFLKGWMLVLSFVIVFTSCNDSEEDVLNEFPTDLSLSERSFLFNSSAVRSKARSNGIGGPAGVLFRIGSGESVNGRVEKNSNVSPIMTIRAMMKKQSASTFGRTENDGDSTAIVDCLIEIFTENEDGSYEYTLDFGDGCDFFGETFKGKLTERGSYKEDTFEASTTYTGFGTDFWEITGTYEYDGTWDFSYDDNDSIDFDWSAEYSYSYDLEEIYEGEGETFTVTSTGNGVESSDQDGYTISEQENQFSYDSGETYSSKVDEPLFMDFSCDDDVFIFVKGKESGIYESDSETINYSIDYGNGDCDNIITVNENGEEYTIDLNEEYDDLGDD